MKLEDITHRFRQPCIMDMKLGRRVWDDFAEQDKIDREQKKYPAQEIYRVPDHWNEGMRVVVEWECYPGVRMSMC